MFILQGHTHTHTHKQTNNKHGHIQVDICLSNTKKHTQTNKIYFRMQCHSQVAAQYHHFQKELAALSQKRQGTYPNNIAMSLCY